MRRWDGLVDSYIEGYRARGIGGATVTAIAGRLDRWSRWLKTYNHFRDYDPVTGRYMQSDPIGLGGGLNTSAYSGGDPKAY